MTYGQSRALYLKNNPQPNEIATEEEMEAEYKRRAQIRRKEHKSRPARSDYMSIGKVDRQVTQSIVSPVVPPPPAVTPVAPPIVKTPVVANYVASEEECMGETVQGGAAPEAASHAREASNQTVISSESSESVVYKSTVNTGVADAVETPKPVDTETKDIIMEDAPTVKPVDDLKAPFWTDTDLSAPKYVDLSTGKAKGKYKKNCWYWEKYGIFPGIFKAKRSQFFNDLPKSPCNLDTVRI